MALLMQQVESSKPGYRCALFTFHSGKLLAFILFAIFFLHGPNTEAQARALSESEIKAAFLFNFTKFVEWPSDAFSDPTSPIVLGIVGDSPVVDLLTETAAGKTVNGRAVIVRRLKDEREFRGCQILFVTASEQKHTLQILEKVKGLPVLMVSEISGFAESGGGINFVVDGNKVRLEINLEAATRARLKISAKVIAVARLITDESTRGKS